MSDVPQVTRRTFMHGTGSALLGAFLTAPARGRPPLLVPQVDKLTLLTIVDNATFGPFLADQILPGLRVEHFSRAGARMPRRTLMAEFGLSILASSVTGSESRQVLVDFGYSAEVLANNLKLLGINPDLFDAAVLSHGHLDHYGGIAGLLSTSTPKRRLTPLLVGGEEVFCERVAAIGTPPPVMGALERQVLLQSGLLPQIAPEPIVVADHAFTTGTIPLDGFERTAIPTRMRPGVGCEVTELSPGKRGAAEIADDAEHELATCYAVKALGLVVIASCSHRGVLNAIRRAQAVSGIDKVHAVVGGFHLVKPRTEEDARRTASELARIDPRYIVPMHCTGEVFIIEATRLMPDKVIRPYVGSRFAFSA